MQTRNGITVHLHFHGREQQEPATKETGIRLSQEALQRLADVSTRRNRPPDGLLLEALEILEAGLHLPLKLSDTIKARIEALNATRPCYEISEALHEAVEASLKKLEDQKA